jgi:predicted Fe-Mo cluster-binding NifX family protein
MKVALTIWDGRVSPVFDVSREALVLTIDGGGVTERRIERLDVASPEHKVGRLAALGVDTLICGAISDSPYQELVSRGVQVLGFVAGDAEAVVEAFQAGRLPSAAFSMPGCRRQRGSMREGGER